MRLTFLTAALAAAVIAVGIVTISSATPAVSSKDVGFSVTDSTQVTIDFQVTKAPEATAECAVQVLSSNYAVVGWATATIGPASEDEPAADARTMAKRVQVRTDSQGVTGGVNACWIVDGG